MTKLMASTTLWGKANPFRLYFIVVVGLFPFYKRLKIACRGNVITKWDLVYIFS